MSVLNLNIRSKLTCGTIILIAIICLVGGVWLHEQQYYVRGRLASVNLSVIGLTNGPGRYEKHMICVISNGNPYNITYSWLNTVEVETVAGNRIKLPGSFLDTPRPLAPRETRVVSAPVYVCHDQKIVRLKLYFHWEEDGCIAILRNLRNELAGDGIPVTTHKYEECRVTTSWITDGNQ
jgi:hypothetical protein